MEEDILNGEAQGAEKDEGEGGPERDVLAALEEKVADMVERRMDALRREFDEKEREASLRDFAAGHPEFSELRENGGLAAALRDNPLLDEVGAYFAAMLEREREAVGEKIEQARAETEQRVVEQLRAKRAAATLGAAPGGAKNGGVDAELAQPEKFGGLKAVIAARLKARRETSGA